MRRPQLRIEDIELAIELKEKGKTWRAIGIELARRRGRKVPFLGTSVSNHVMDLASPREKGPRRKIYVCFCDDIESAELIAIALNREMMQ